MIKTSGLLSNTKPWTIKDLTIIYIYKKGIKKTTSLNSQIDFFKSMKKIGNDGFY